MLQKVLTTPAMWKLVLVDWPAGRGHPRNSVSWEITPSVGTPTGIAEDFGATYPHTPRRVGRSATCRSVRKVIKIHHS